MKKSEIAEMILSSNNVSPERYKEFMKELRITLRLDYEYPAPIVRKMNDNKVIETWYEEHKKEQIGGAYETDPLY